MDQKLKLLLVDDEYGIRESLRDFFELDGFEVYEAKSGSEAVASLDNLTVDIVLSDVRMPEGDGRYLLNSIKARHPSKPKVVLMSGFTDLTVEEAYHEGAHGFLSKPFNPQTVANYLKSVMAGAGTELSAEISNSKWHEVLIQCRSLREAIELKQMACGQNGVFLPMNPVNLKPLQKVRIQFLEQNHWTIGEIKWTRHSETSARPMGIGIEFLYFSNEFKKELQKYLESQNPVATIPMKISA